jgi:hypothetical protein
MAGCAVACKLPLKVISSATCCNADLAHRLLGFAQRKVTTDICFWTPTCSPATSGVLPHTPTVVHPLLS